MWVMTTRGFFSAVQDRKVPTRLLIRARTEGDIRSLKDVLPDSDPWRLAKSDYEWRLSCTTAEWAAALATMALDIDYPNFKNAVKARQGAERASVYMRVWSALLSLERGWYSRSFPKVTRPKATRPPRRVDARMEPLPLMGELEQCPFCFTEAVYVEDPEFGGPCDNCGEYVTRGDLEVANG